MTPYSHQTYDKNKWAHRRLEMSPHNTDPQVGDDVKALQMALNDRAKTLHLHGVVVDGQFGRHTLGKAWQIARFLGMKPKGPGVSAYVQHIIRHPGLRTPFQRSRGVKYRTHHPTQLPVHVDGNTVTGGTMRQRVVAAAMQAAHLFYEGRSHRFYSQVGITQFEKGITGESPGERSDCSQFVTSMHHSAGAPDPCAGDYNPASLHYTGTLMNGGHYVSRNELKPAGSVLYGPKPHHHVEEWVGNGDGKTTYAELAHQGSAVLNRTVGHGSPPVDYGEIDMIAGPIYFVNYDLDKP